MEWLAYIMQRIFYSLVVLAVVAVLAAGGIGYCIGSHGT